jgi:hypothetical protein
MQIDFSVLEPLKLTVIQPIFGHQLPRVAQRFIGALNADGRCVQEFVGQAL